MSKLNELLAKEKIHAWYWGHEHRLVIYDQHPHWRFYGRCVGHGGMPYFRDSFPGSSPHVTAFYKVAGGLKSNIMVPNGEVLDGPNPYLLRDQLKYGPQGYLVLELEGSRIHESYRAPNGSEIRRQTIE